MVPTRVPSKGGGAELKNLIFLLILIMDNTKNIRLYKNKEIVLHESLRKS